MMRNGSCFIVLFRVNNQLHDPKEVSKSNSLLVWQRLLNLSINISYFAYKCTHKTVNSTAPRNDSKWCERAPIFPTASHLSHASHNIVERRQTLYLNVPCTPSLEIYFFPYIAMQSTFFLVSILAYICFVLFVLNPPHKQEIITSPLKLVGLRQSSIQGHRDPNSVMQKAKGKQKVWRHMHEAQKLHARLLRFAFCWYRLHQGRKKQDHRNFFLNE